MPAIDLNADLAEGETLTATDLALLDLVTSASIACGFHAGSRALMRETASACAERQVAIGAHVSYRDRAGFGRRVLDVAPDELAADVVEQWEALAEDAASVGAAVAYVKPHGALYDRMAVDGSVAAAVVGAMAPYCRVLVAPPGSAVARPAGRAQVRLVAEGFCDRGYDRSGRLVARGSPGALVDDPDAVGERVRSLVLGGGVAAVDGTWVPLAVETLCIHGDHPGAEQRALAVREALAGAGVTVRPFAGTGGG